MSELRVIRPNERDPATNQTPGMSRFEGVGARTTGATSLWSGYVTVDGGFKSAAHHHGESESAIYIVSGHARMRWGEHLENTIEAGPGDFIFVPAYLIHQEINVDSSEEVAMIVSRGAAENITVNLDIPEAKEA